MKKIVLILALILLAQKAKAAVQTQDVGAVSFATSTAIVVTTTPVICLSTAVSYSNNGLDNIVSSTNPIQQMPNRIYAEFYNDTSTDVWIGPTINVSTMPGVNMGRRIPPGFNPANNTFISGALNSYVAYDSLPWYVVAATTTQRSFLIIQKK